MTDQPFDEEIPELVDSLEGSLHAPSAEAIHAGLGRRQAARKRMLGAAGAFVAVLAITGAVFALTRDDDTSTVTADDTGVAAADSGDSSGELPAVGEDSTPRLEGTLPLPPEIDVNGWSDPIDTRVQIASCSNGSRIQADGSTWLAWQLPEVWAGQGLVPVTAIIQDGDLIAVDEDGHAARFSRHTPGTVSLDICFAYGDQFGWQVDDTTDTSLAILATIGDIPFDRSLSRVALRGDIEDLGSLVFVSPCHGSRYRVQWTAGGFTVIEAGVPTPRQQGILCEDYGTPFFFAEGDEVAVAISPDVVVLDVRGDTSWQLILDGRVVEDNEELPPLGPHVVTDEATVVIQECANFSWLTFDGGRWTPKDLPSVWQRESKVNVTLLVDGESLVASDDAGNSAPFWLNDGSDSDDYCSTYNLEQDEVPPTTVPVETTVPTTTTTAAPTGSPAFAPSADLALSGQWEPVGMWNDGVAVDLDGFNASISIFGRRLGGRDGCNNHGIGVFYATANGQVQLQSGTITAMGCIDNEPHELFRDGTFGATQWGRTSAGNLVLTNGTVVVEFELTEGVPVGSLTDLAASLDTIWRSERPGDFVNVPPGGSGVTLTFMADFEIGVIAVVTVEDCGEFGFAAVYEDQTEGEISFEPLSDANPTDCELSESAQLTLDALPRADYFATAEGGLGLWDGPAPLASFFDQ